MSIRRTCEDLEINRDGVITVVGGWECEDHYPMTDENTIKAQIDKNLEEGKDRVVLYTKMQLIYAHGGMPALKTFLKKVTAWINRCGTDVDTEKPW